MRERAPCAVCGCDMAVTPRGVVFSHRTPDGVRRCPGMGNPPGRGPTGDPDIDATLVAIAGEVAPGARHAARVLRHLGPLLRDTRTRRGLTLRQLAPLVNVDKGTLSHIENGLHPSMATALKLLDWIGGAA